MNRRLLLLVAVPVLLLSLPAAAQDEEEGVPLDMEFKNMIIKGQGKPCLKLTAQGDIKKLRVQVARAGMTKKFKLGRLAGGAAKRFCWREKVGVYTYTLKMSCKY